MDMARNFHRKESSPDVCSLGTTQPSIVCCVGVPDLYTYYLRLRRLRYYLIHGGWCAVVGEELAAENGEVNWFVLIWAV